MRIGVFDSGKGGQLIARRLETLLPGNEWVVIDDIQNVPYGEKDQTTIVTLTDQAITPLLANCPIIVIACNTATTAAISTLRERYPNTKFVGVEPMIKPAVANSPAAHITLLATPYTLRSLRYTTLKSDHGHTAVIDEPDTTGWPRLIDDGHSSDIDLTAIANSVTNGSDTIVLACTHYLELIPFLKTRFPGIAILEPSEALARQVRHLAS